MPIKQNIRKTLLFLAYSLNFPFAKWVLSRYIDQTDKYRQILFDKFEINKVLDVGANIGQYAKRLQHAGFKGHLISFEPINPIRELLAKSVVLFNNWQLLEFALGDQNQKSIINISGNTASSSVLKMEVLHELAAPESIFVGTQEIEVRTLDSLFDTLVEASDKVFLKVDTQGYEWHVLQGSLQSLEKVWGLELEISFVQLYHGEHLFPELYEFLLSKGFQLYNIEPMLRDPHSGQLLQADCVFFRSHT